MGMGIYDCIGIGVGVTWDIIHMHGCNTLEWHMYKLVLLHVAMDSNAPF